MSRELFEKLIGDASLLPWKVDRVGSAYEIEERGGDVVADVSSAEWDGGPDARLIALAVNHLAGLVAALEEISEGAGAYDPDLLNHAENCINEMKETASSTLAALYAEVEGNS